MSQQQQRREPWRNQERHYCAICNSWMGGDRQSILIHENGKKHQENVEKSLKQKRLDKLNEEKASKSLQASLAKIQQVAALAHAQDVASGNFATTVTTSGAVAPTVTGTTLPIPHHHHQQQQLSSSQSHQRSDGMEKESWEARKRKRQEEFEAKKRLKEKGQDDNDNTGSGEEQFPTTKQPTKKIGLEEGHYTIDGVTYLEGPTFAPLLEEDMPIQIWTGSIHANLTEKKLPEKMSLWKNGLIVQTRQRKTAKTTTATTSSSEEESSTRIVVDVAYLLQSTDTDETLEKSVQPDRIRVILGSDTLIPDTLEEARLAVMGGEIIEHQGTSANHHHQQQQPEIDENTGLSSWGTVSVKRTTIRNEHKEERERLRAKRRAEIQEAERQRHEVEGRKMEEAKVENADDSALGAFDVWNSGKAGYKGVDINKEAKLDVHETGKSLSKGKGSVGFKKRGGMFNKNKMKKKQNRRTTSADDD